MSQIMAHERRDDSMDKPDLETQSINKPQQAAGDLLLTVRLVRAEARGEPLVATLNLLLAPRTHFMT